MLKSMWFSMFLSILTLFSASNAIAGTFRIIEYSEHLASDYGDSVQVQTSSKARYFGTVDPTDTHWQIGASLRPAGGSWRTGTPNNGGNIFEGKTITCEPATTTTTTIWFLQ